jgi:hypothetical protein
MEDNVTKISKIIKRLVKPIECLIATSMLVLTVSCGSATEVSSNDLASAINNINVESTAAEKNDAAAPGETQDTEKKALYPARLDYMSDLGGYIDDRGTFVIKPKFTYAYRFTEDGIAKVEVDGNVGVIDQNGEYIIKPEYLSIDDFHDGRAIAERDDGYVLIDTTGKVLSKTYSYLYDYSDGRVKFYVQIGDDHLYGLLDRDGKEVVKPEYKNIGYFENGVATADIGDGKYILIDKNGKRLADVSCRFVSNISDGLIAFLSEGGESNEDRYGYMDLKGNVVIEPRFTGGEDFINGTAVVNTAGYNDYELNKYGLIDKNGKFLIEPKYNEIIQLGEGMLAVGIPLEPDMEYIGLKYALAANSGKLLTDFIFLKIGKFENGVASVYDKTQTYFIDKEGKKVTSLPQFDGSGTMERLGDVVYANIDNRECYINKQGDTIYKPSGKVELENGITIEEKKFRPNINYLVYMPQMTGFEDAKVQENVNAKLQELWKDPTIKQDTVMDHNYNGMYNIGFHKNNLLEIEQSGYDYPIGAAHGMPGKKYYHIDVKTGRFYELKDLFKSGSNYTTVLGKLVNRQIKEGKNEDVMLYDDNEVEVRKDQPFFLSEDSLMVYYTPYEIAPYAAGFPTFTIPFTELEDIIDKEGNFWKSFNNVQ